MSDDARFCEICGTPVADVNKRSSDHKFTVDPHYDLSVFSDDSDVPPKPQPKAPAPDELNRPEDDDSAATVLLPDQHHQRRDVLKRPAPRRGRERADTPVKDDSEKTEFLPESERRTQPAQRNRFEENIAMNRRLREERKRSDYAEPVRRKDPQFRDEYRGYQPAAQNDYRSHDRRGEYQAPYRAPEGQAGRHADGIRPDTDHRGNATSPKKNKQKKWLIISLIALILVIAILAGVIFFVNRNTVSAAELREAKDKYLPPSQVVRIDTSADDPSNDDIQFKYDDRARILSCTYEANKKPYELNYTYYDPERRVDIETTYKNNHIDTHSIMYDDVRQPDVFEDIDGYYIRLDKESVNSAVAAPAPVDSVTETETPPETPTEARMINEVPPDAELEHFIQKFVDYQDGGDPTDGTAHVEYDCRNTLNTSQNILASICTQNCCIDWSTYTGEAQRPFSNGIVNPWTQQSGMMVMLSDRERAEWICRNIFNITDDEIAQLYERGYQNQMIWKDDTLGANYCTGGGKGSTMQSGKVLSVQTDGEFYYVTYGVCLYDVNLGGPGEPTDTYFAVMKKKTTDRGEFWSLYFNTSDVPTEITPFDSQGR